MIKYYSIYIKDKNFIKGNEWWEYVCPNLNSYILIKILGDLTAAEEWQRYGMDDEHFSYLDNRKISNQSKERLVKILFGLNLIKQKPHPW